VHKHTLCRIETITVIEGVTVSCSNFITLIDDDEQLIQGYLATSPHHPSEQCYLDLKLLLPFQLSTLHNIYVGESTGSSRTGKIINFRNSKLLYVHTP
jgi:hypothetical protein